MRGRAARRASTRSCAVQLNDTHPAIAVAELMRLLVDEHATGLGRRPGRSRSGRFAYTNHTLLPEALETWPLPLFGALLPRHLEIIYEINRRFLDERAAALSRTTRRACARLSLIDETGEQHVRMAHLASVGSHAINGVAALHSRAARSRPCCATSTSSGRRSSTTRPTASRRGAGCVLRNPRLSRADHRGASATAGSPTSSELRELEPLRRRRRLPRASGARSSARTSDGWPRCIQRAHRRRGRSRRRCSTCRSSGCTSTSGSS